MMQIDLKDHFIKALKTNPNFSEAHLQLALLYQEEGNHKNVAKHFDSAILSDIEKVKTLEQRGDELLKNFQFQNAKEQFMKSQDTKNHCAEVYYQQSVYLKHQNRIKAAQISLENSIKMNPSKSDVHRDLGVLLSQQNRLDDARLQFEKALDINYADPKSHFHLGIIMGQMQDIEDAEQHFLSALDINPKFADCMVELASLKLKMDQKKEAKIYYQMAKQIKPKLMHITLEKIMH